jgi:hypothetical protein
VQDVSGRLLNDRCSIRTPSIINAELFAPAAVAPLSSFQAIHMRSWHDEVDPDSASL